MVNGTSLHKPDLPLMMMVKKFNLIILVWYSIISAGSEIPRCIDMTSMENLERVPTRKSRRENLISNSCLRSDLSKSDSSNEVKPLRKRDLAYLEKPPSAEGPNLRRCCGDFAKIGVSQILWWLLLRFRVQCPTYRMSSQLLYNK